MQGLLARFRRSVPAEMQLLSRLMIAGALLFAGSRLALVTLCAERLTGVEPMAVVRALALGTFQDLSLIAWLLLPVWMLVCLPRVHWVHQPRVRAAVSGWIGVITFLLLIGVASDLAHFREFDVRLNGTSLDYLRQPAHLLAVLYHEFALIPVVAAMLLFSWLAARRGGRLLMELAHARTHGTARLATGGSALLVLLSLCAGAPALADSEFIASSSSEWPRGYLVDQLTINGTSNFMGAWFAELGNEAPLRERVRSGDGEQAENLVRDVVGGPGDTFLDSGLDIGGLDSGGTPLWRATDTGRPLTRPNVVLVLMESFSARGIGSLGGRYSDAPRFDALAKESLLFSNLYAVGTRTNRGLAGVLSSMPALPGVSPICALEPGERMMTIADVLRDRGYSTLALCGGDREYDNLEAYTVGNGFDRLVALDDFAAPTFSTEWGVSDEDLFDRALEEFGDLAQREEPFFGFVLTLSNHRPYRVPAGRVAPADANDEEGVQRMVFRYADHALGRFMDAAKAQPWYADTVFVFVADHGRHARNTDAPDVESFRIPLLIHAPGRVAPRRVTRVASQLDVAPTVLGLLGGTYESAFFGSDQLQPGAPARAMLSVGDYLAWTEGGTVAVWPPHGPLEYFDLSSDGRLAAFHPEPDVSRRLASRLRSTARVAFDVSRGRTHRDPKVRSAPEGSEAR